MLQCLQCSAGVQCIQMLKVSNASQKCSYSLVLFEVHEEYLKMSQSIFDVPASLCFNIYPYPGSSLWYKAVKSMNVGGNTNHAVTI